MPQPPKTKTIASCLRGNVELQLFGTPILSTVCYCDDCQAGARQIEALPNAQPVQGYDGGTAYVLYRKDRVEHAKGAQLLQNYKLKKESATSRAVATCCNSAMMLTFDGGPHWIPVYRARLQGDLPPVEMHVQTKFKPKNSAVPNGVPSYASYPFKFMAKLVVAKIAMLLGR